MRNIPCSRRSSGSACRRNRVAAGWVLAPLVSILMSGCASDADVDVESEQLGLTGPARRTRSAAIRDVAASRGLTNGVLLAGIAQVETGLSHCWSEATWACQGPHSAFCGGPVIAGASDGPCSAQQGGLGMFQFDAGTYSQTLARDGSGILQLDGNISRAVDFVTNIVRQEIPGAGTTALAIAWMNSIPIASGNQRFEQWTALLACRYNGRCGSASQAALYRNATLAALSEFGADFWRVSPPVRHFRTLPGDFNGDGKIDIATVSANALFAWGDAITVEYAAGTGFTSAFVAAQTPRHMRNGGADSDYRVLTGDFNGDGKTDIATVSPNGLGGWGDAITVEYATGTGFTSAFVAAQTPRHMRNGGAGSDYRVLTGDFNGDGKTDIATVSPNGLGGWSDAITVEYATGTGFTSAFVAAQTPRHMRNGGAGSDYRVLTGDFNGDGKTDIATVSRNGLGGWSDAITVEYATGTGFTSAFVAAQTPRHMRNGGAGSDYRVLTGDFNGDGKTDIATVSPNGLGGWGDAITVEYATGTGFTSAFVAAQTPRHMRNGGAGSDYRVLTGDLDGDGKTDIATVSRNALFAWGDAITVEYATGTGFTSGFVAAQTPRHMRNGGADSDYRVLTGDFNGDGQSDIATVSPNGLGGWSDAVTVEYATGTGFTSAFVPAQTPRHMRNGS
jgi:hypothetical protein